MQASAPTVYGKAYRLAAGIPAALAPRLFDSARRPPNFPLYNAPKMPYNKTVYGPAGCGRYENSGVCPALRPRPPRRTEARDSTVFKIIQRRELNPTVTELVLEAPLIAKKAQAGQFIIIRAKEDSERIPLTIAGYDREAGTVSIIFQVVGAGTMELNTLPEGGYVHDFVGPLGKATEIEGLKKVCVVGGGVGCAIALPVAQALHAQGTKVTGIVGFRDKDLVILEDEFRACCDELIIMTDDGSYGRKGVVTVPLAEKLDAGETFDEVITIGPLVMMKFVVATTKPHNVKTVVSMNPIMVDGTGMCGGCRLTVGGKTKFACVDGPDFDGFEVDFDEAMHRGTMYKEFEAHAREAACNLFKKEVE